MLNSKVLFVLFGCVLAMAAAAGLGGVSELSGEELQKAESRLSLSLAKLKEGDGPHYSISKVRSATSQVVSGISYKFDVELIDSAGAKKDCKVGIWDQSWLPEGIEVTFECEGEEKVVRKHSA